MDYVSNDERGASLIIRVAVLRGQVDIRLNILEGSYRLFSSGMERLIHSGEKLELSLSSSPETGWIKRTRFASADGQNTIPSGVECQALNPQGEVLSLHSHRYFELEETLNPNVTDSLFTHAIAIAKSEAIGNTIVYPDERRHSNPNLTLGWTPVAAPITFEPLHRSSRIQVSNVRIGIGFHWDHEQSLSYHGTLHIEKLNSGLCAVIECPMEEYLASVNSSEMPADLPVEFLKAQTIAARSWLLANLGTHHTGAPFDICADDHCQCYHGDEKLRNNSVQAMEETRGQILICKDRQGNHRITDARYAKTCGGRFELGELVWGGETAGLVHSAEQRSSTPIDNEEHAQQVLVDTTQDDFCNPSIYPYPTSLKYAEPFYRWEQIIYRYELCQLIERSMGYKWDTVDKIEILKRGLSGRIIAIRFHRGSESFDVYGELAIRRIFSNSHLPSSAFIIESDEHAYILKGAGWGHGAGLCQTGGVNRALQGQQSEQILSSYYPTSTIAIIQEIKR